MKNLVNLDDVINLLIEEGDLRGKDKIKHTKPTHGPCCTCQDCGYYHDDCVCYHNELLDKLNKLEKFTICHNNDLFDKSNKLERS